jgi:transposase
MTSADLGSELRESGSAATAVAPAPDGASAHANDEPTAGSGAQRGPALQEAVVAGSPTAATGIIPAGSVGKPAATRNLLELMDRLNPTITELIQAIEQEVKKCPEGQRLMTHPGVGALTGLAFVLIIGKAERFRSGKQVASYLGLVPLEESSGNWRRLGHITKQGISMLRFLLVEAAQVTVRSLPEWRSKYLHLMMRRGRKTAKVAMACRLVVRLYRMMLYPCRVPFAIRSWRRSGLGTALGSELGLDHPSRPQRE